MPNVPQAVREAIRNAQTRLTQLDVERQVSRCCQVNRGKVRSAIKELVGRQELMYVSDFGRTFIETSLHKPIRIAANIVLKPWNCAFEKDAGDIVISLCHGISFGSGRHPTTRLCLKGLEYLQGTQTGLGPPGKTRALDIGTGSGVLIITALKMGVTSGIGVDIDACARSEARINAIYNGVSERVAISSEPFGAFKEAFHLIMANLRWPTLTSLLPQIVDKTTPGGNILVSGIKSEEMDSFVKQGQDIGLNRVWVGEERG
ncbi:MAG: 50S ribosomal protein L11 methyltransferase, partial [Deltaproteobacteria bacterium]|nr:50S ribosomal protein L11 methyltransferase [Deltaproteobacteria bacterium]